jgi:hypothetical protein
MQPPSPLTVVSPGSSRARFTHGAGHLVLGHFLAASDLLRSDSGFFMVSASSDDFTREP